MAIDFDTLDITIDIYKEFYVRIKNRLNTNDNERVEKEVSKFIDFLIEQYLMFKNKPTKEDIEVVENIKKRRSYIKK